MDLKQLFLQQISCTQLSEQTISKLLVEVDDVTKGDFTIPCFRLSKEMRKSPVAIANELAIAFKTTSLIDRVEAVNGYLNFFVNRQAFADLVCQKALADNYGSSQINKDKTICIDFSSVNIAKPFHMGHLGTTAIGNSLSKLLTFTGANVVRINHLGDWGTQFGKLIVALKLWGDRQKIEQHGLKALQEIYTRFHVEEEKDPSLTEQARAWFAKIEKGDHEAMQLFKYFTDITLVEVKKIYQRLNVEFDNWDGESFYNDKMQPVLDLLRQKGLTEISDGAEIVALGDKMPPCLLVKSDGATLYATRDIAAAVYRKQTYNFDKCLYVVAYQQNLHFQQYFKVLEMAGFEWAKDLLHIAYGIVSLEEGSMSTRKGNIVWLNDVLDMAVEKAAQTIEQKSPTLQNKQQVAEQVGVGAVIFSALANSRIKDVVFTFDRVLNFDGETCPYLQYTNARALSVLQKVRQSGAGAFGAQTLQAPDYSVCNSQSCHTVVRLLAKFTDVVATACADYEPSVVTNYLLDLAKAFNKMYLEHRIMRENTSEQLALVNITQSVSNVLTKGLELLGIQAPIQM